MYISENQVHDGIGPIFGIYKIIFLKVLKRILFFNLNIQLIKTCPTI